MTLQRNANTRYRYPAPVTAVAAATQLEPVDQVVLVTNGTYTITLPAVGESAGVMISFIQQGTGVLSVTIADKGDDPAWTDAIINAQNEKVVAYCDGVAWHMLAGQTS